MKDTSFAEKFNALNLGLRMSAASFSFIRENPSGADHPEIFGSTAMADALLLLALDSQNPIEGVSRLGRFSSDLKNLALAIDRRCKSPDRYISPSARKFCSPFEEPLHNSDGEDRALLSALVDQLAKETWGGGANERN